MVSRSTSTVLASARVTVSVLLPMAKPPEAWKKPKASMVTLPLASSSAPRWPSMSSVTLLDGPVATSRFCCL